MAFSRFLIAGALNTGLTYLLYLGLLFLMPYVWAYSLTYETYFARYGSSAANIYDKLFTDQKQTQSVRTLRYFAV